MRMYVTFVNDEDGCRVRAFDLEVDAMQYHREQTARGDCVYDVLTAAIEPGNYAALIDTHGCGDGSL